MQMRPRVLHNGARSAAADMNAANVRLGLVCSFFCTRAGGRQAPPPRRLRTIR